MLALAETAAAVDPRWHVDHVEAELRRVTDLFTRYQDADVRDLVAGYPLAWVAARDGAGASLLPLLGDHDADGRLVGLLGHMARRNPLFAALTADPATTILFTGPHGYISPDHAERRNWGPTWNYARLAITGETRFHPEETASALTALTHAMEGDRWTSDELGARYEGMVGAVVAFRVRIVALEARFKLGQDEAPEVFAAIARNHPNAMLVRWMRRFRR